MRKGFEGLNALVGAQLQEDVRGDALFVFTNKRHTRLSRGPGAGPRLSLFWFHGQDWVCKLNQAV